MSSIILLQDYSKECVSHVQKYLMKHEVPPNLFEVISKTHTLTYLQLTISVLHIGDPTAIVILIIS